jgi:methionyl-tRNA synthetase
MNEIASFVRGGLKDLSISRATLKWGIPLPDDPAHVFYVWFDALTGYLSGISFKTDDEKFNRYWPVDMHLVGKDILRFHTVYWPAFLIAAGLERRRRSSVTAGGCSRMKRCRIARHVFDPHVLLDTFGSELLPITCCAKWCSARIVTSALTPVIQRANSDLANDLGNLLSRTLAMCPSTVRARSIAGRSARRTATSAPRRARWVIGGVPVRISTSTNFFARPWEKTCGN